MYEESFEKLLHLVWDQTKIINHLLNILCMNFQYNSNTKNPIKLNNSFTKQNEIEVSSFVVKYKIRYKTETPTNLHCQLFTCHKKIQWGIEDGD